MSQAGSLSQAMDITTDAAATVATTLAASAVGNTTSQMAAPRVFRFGHRASPGAVNMLEIIKYLQSMEKRLTASNQINYKKLNESLLEKIVELSQMIKSLNGRINFLEEQYESFKNQQANNKNFVPVDRPLPVVQPTPSTPEPPMRTLPATPRNGQVSPQTTRVHLAPTKD
jgi:hypothetical protein